jgi:tripartite-type tricarboxylate transporter receptor subunit TctC
MLIILIGAALTEGVASAQQYPSKPIRMIVPFTRGRRTGSRRGVCTWGGDGARPPGLWQSVIHRAFAALFAAASICAPPVAAQTYPSKPIRMIVPYTPGGSTDIVARVVGQKLGEALRAQVVIDNRPGAGGNIGVEAAAKSAPDGYTLVMGHIGTFAVNPALYAKLPYDPVRDFAPISLAAIVPNLLVVHPSLPVKSVKDLIALSRSRPGQLNYGSSGPGGTPYLAVEYFKLMAKLDIVQIPYKGAAPMIVDLIGGQLALTITGIPPLLPHVKAGRLRPLAVATSKRLPLLPDLPTIAEAALPGYEATSWYGVLAPAATPKEIIARLNAEIVKSIANPDTAERLSGEGAQPTASTPEQFGAFIKSEIARWGKVIKGAGVTAE